MSLDPSARPPTILDLRTDFDAAKVFNQTGMEQRVLDANDPRTLRAHSQLAILGYGCDIYRHDTDWDTLCITYGDNRSHLMNHPGFGKCISHDLRKLAKMSVEVVDIPRRGLGLRATRDIDGGQTFLIERPLLTCTGTMAPSTVVNFDMLIDKGMTTRHKEAYMKLHNCKPKEAGAVESLNIMRTNALGADWTFDDEKQRTVYEIMSRANHSCVPNAAYQWNFASFTGALISLLPIKKGDEITISYSGRMLRPAAERKAELLQKYSFHCTCPACTMSPERQRKSDDRRVAIGKRNALHLENNSFDEHRIEVGYDDGYILETLKLCDAEGLIEERIEMMVAYARFEAMRARVTGDFGRSEQVAKRAIKEIKKSGLYNFWAQMDEILKEKKKAGTEPPRPNIIEVMKLMTLENFENSYVASSSAGNAGGFVGPDFKSLTHEQRKTMLRKEQLKLLHMLMLNSGAQLKRVH
ncbi:SET domain-containing protein [Calocera viscosa TUFC12733]|uniref:SET domain-containing protein n=1 Tax=Calocera viscosa (strain TUFC12733) TaxID=1330018 RepID=A0A167MLH6_CALVF|nr:SET domain-containing protein [Calocera viscosa TUFC12733]